MFTTVFATSVKDGDYNYWSGYKISTPIMFFFLLMLIALLTQPIIEFCIRIKNNGAKSISEIDKLYFIKNTINVFVGFVLSTIILLTLNLNYVFNVTIERLPDILTFNNFTFKNLIYPFLNFTILGIHFLHRFDGGKFYERVEKYTEFHNKNASKNNDNNEKNEQTFAIFSIIKSAIQLTCAIILTFSNIGKGWNVNIFPQLIIYLILNIAILVFNNLIDEKIETLKNNFNDIDENFTNEMSENKN